MLFSRGTAPKYERNFADNKSVLRKESLDVSFSENNDERSPKRKNKQLALLFAMQIIRFYQSELASILFVL